MRRKPRAALSIGMILLLLGGMPGIILAATESTTTGSFTASNVAPTVSSVDLWTTGGGASSTTTMTPQVQYNVKVAVTDNNTLDDLTTVKVYIYYDADGTYDAGDRPGAGNTQTCAILTWTNPNTWEIDPNASTTWAVVSGSCSAPSLSGSTGTFQFHFKPGKVATESPGADEWHIYAVANDGTATGDNYLENLEMNWYGEITGVTATSSFGTVSLGATAVISGTISATYIANGAYDEQVKSSATWTGQTTSTELTLYTSGTTPGSAEFALLADDDGTVAGAVQVLSAGYATIDDTGSQTGETGDTVSNNHLWLWVGSSGIPAEEYQGTIYFKIADGS